MQGSSAVLLKVSSRDQQHQNHLELVRNAVFQSHPRPNEYLVTKDNGLNPKGLNKSMMKPKIQPKYPPAKYIWILGQNPIYLCTKLYLHSSRI